MAKYSKSVKFRFVITDDNDNILEVLYETSKEYNSQWDSEWREVCYHKVLELNERYDFSQQPPPKGRGLVKEQLSY